jgi:hypothetical protein
LTRGKTRTGTTRDKKNRTGLHGIRNGPKLLVSSGRRGGIQGRMHDIQGCHLPVYTTFNAATYPCTRHPRRPTARVHDIQGGHLPVYTLFKTDTCPCTRYSSSLLPVYTTFKASDQHAFIVSASIDQVYLCPGQAGQLRAL